MRFPQNKFEGKTVAAFVSSTTAGDSKRYDEAFKRYIGDVLIKYPYTKPVATEAFGGRIGILGFAFVDNRDMEKIRSWQMRLVESLAKTARIENKRHEFDVVLACQR